MLTGEKDVLKLNVKCIEKLDIKYSFADFLIWATFHMSFNQPTHTYHESDSFH